MRKIQRVTIRKKREIVSCETPVGGSPMAPFKAIQSGRSVRMAQAIGTMKNKLSDLVEPTSAELFHQPLEFLLSEHYRQRIICNTLETSPFDPRNALSKDEMKAIVAHLSLDYPLHLADEELSLFPLLAKRCLPADNVGEILDQLTKEHEVDRPLIARVIGFLNAALADEETLDLGPYRESTAAMTEAQRRHLAWENSVVLPLAKRRLKPADLTDLGRDMARRRGIQI